MATYGPSPYSGFYSPASAYGSPWGAADAFLTTPLGNVLANEDPQAYYQRLIAPWGGGNDAYSQWAQDQQGRFLSGLAQARLTNPLLGVQEFGATAASPWAMRQQFRGLDPVQRGEQWNRYAPLTRVRGW